jgi:hypothetical protein
MSHRSGRWTALLGGMGWWVCAATFAAQTGGNSPSTPAATPKLPAETLLVKGAWSSASDTATPVPEGGTVADRRYANDYFGLDYPLPANWIRQYQGPPPSDSGYYVLAQIVPKDSSDATQRGTLLITAQDLFFTPVPATSARDFVTAMAGHLDTGYQVEQAPSQVRIGDRSFVRFGYASPAIGLHWYVLATQIRCHVVQFVFTTRDRALTDKLLREFRNVVVSGAPDEMPHPNAGDRPVCIKGYASSTNVVERVEPVLLEHRFSPIPVRVIIDTQGKVKHVHFLSAFPSDAKTITDALLQWRFKPYVIDGRPVEVETGIVFGRELPVTASRRAPK